MTTQNIAANPAPAPGAVAPVAGAVDPNAPAKGSASGSLYVGDLAPDVTEARLFEIFNPVGPVSSIRVCRDSNTRQSLGYAYVNFHSAEDAERALDTLNFHSIKGNPCRIMWSHRDPSIRKTSTANIFIKNLDKSIDNKELYDTFSQFGSILSSKVATDSAGVSKGHAYVHYADEIAASKAIDEVNGKMIKDKKVYCAKHERRQDRQGSEMGAKMFTNLYVKNIPEDWNQEKFQTVFTGFGKITSCVLKVNEDNTHKGFGFVNYETHDDAVKAMEEGNKYPLGDDKFLYVGRFQKRAEREASLRREKNEKYKNLNLFVKNLVDDVDEAKLRELFEPFGELTSCVVMSDDKGVSRGFGFVCFAKSEEATKALTEMNGKMVGAKPIYVNWHQRKEDRRAHLESQFQQSLATQRMHSMPMFYGPPNAGGMPMPNMMYPMMQQRGGPGRSFPPQQPPMRGPYNQPPYPQQRRGGPRNFRGGPGGPNQQKVRPNAGRPFPQQMPSVQPPIPAQSTVPGELTSSSLASATPEAQKQMLGERLFPLVNKEQPQLAGKITGMLLEMDVTEILTLLEYPDELKLKVTEAREVLDSHVAQA